jgi:hypothetical protein
MVSGRARPAREKKRGDGFWLIFTSFSAFVAAILVLADSFGKSEANEEPTIVV